MTDEMPTEETPDASAPEPVAEAAPAAGPPRGAAQLPAWLTTLAVVFLVVFVVGGLGFAVGRLTADDDLDDHLRHMAEHGMSGPMHGGMGGGMGDMPHDMPNMPGMPDGMPDMPHDTPNMPRMPNPPGDGQEVTPADAAFLGVAVETATGDVDGAAVTDVAAGSPAGDAGLEVGDVITELDGNEITNARGLRMAVLSHDVGDEVTVTYVRKGKTDEAEVTLASRADFEVSPPTTTGPAS